ncbi:MAG: cyclic nucleotide-binding domain-containing protein [Nitrospinaceae bacterium]|nr:cyclic nucleotide-binding domain-containing protein [Nitrospinaceae bacterium]NIR56439.1 cyclic nucleotide-binding domain-containing protein [Nitrospinaceae bacterium]NIS86901.1 cyclic nucleotide-binding domain-containing protein [Nitrospinaceae bacterium]NIT83738.1 cyclic nucleotide-binding domain-containing protein [Nitrospinaceae bacterium]NIU45942.1 cyclic nucleotide-binding domain-containing protein [Nitrospinaceae bacterium]
MTSLRPILEEHPFFKDLESRYLDLLAGCARNVRFEAGEILFHEGDPADRFFLIRQGKVALEMAPPNQEPMIIDTIEEDLVFGWSWMVPPYKWHFDALALTLVRAISVDGKCLREKCEKDHELGYELFKRFFSVVTERLQHTRMQLLDVYGGRT